MAPNWNDVDRRDMSRVRPLPRAPSPSVTQNEVKCQFIRYWKTIASMQISGFHTWGFLIVRTCYNDKSKELWGPFLARIRAEVDRRMTTTSLGKPNNDESAALLLPLVRWDVLEDEFLDGATIDEARRRFDTWRAAVSVERDGPAADHLKVRSGSIARFRYFIMVDEESLASLEEAAPFSDKRSRMKPPIKVRVVDAGLPEGVDHLRSGHRPEVESGEDNDDESPSSNAPNEDDGWMWVEAQLILSMYDTLQGDSGWDHIYVPPPEVYGRSR